MTEVNTYEQYNLRLLELGKKILSGLDSIGEEFVNFKEELDKLLCDAEKDLGMYFTKDAFVTLNLTDEEQLLVVALFYLEKSTGMPMLVEDAHKIISVHLMEKYRKSLASCFIVNGKYMSLSSVLASYMDGELPTLPQGMTFKFPKTYKGFVREDLKKQAESFFTVSKDALTPCALVISGEEGSGRHDLLEQVIAEQDLPLMWLTVTNQIYSIRELNAFLECSLLYGAFVAVSMEYNDQTLIQWLSDYFTSIAIVTDEKVSSLDHTDYQKVEINMPASKKKQDIVSMNIIQSRLTFDDLKLPKAIHAQLMSLCDMIAVRKKVLSEWGFFDKYSYGNGMSILFYGAPGTGKTMAAGVIANALNLPLYRVDLSQLISKYIGETQKNIGRIFDEAEKMDCILLFDEADAIFSKRSDVSDAQDRYSNAETAYLLQRIEQYNGVSILATNLLQNFDEAFRRRISYMVHFPLPDENLRCEMWQNVFPKETEVSEDFDALALAQAFDLSGAAIKNAALHAAFMAMAEYVPVGMKHILEAIANEYSKMGKNLSKAQTELYNAYH